MMNKGNVTQEQGVCRDLGEPTPQPGCHLVVFEEEGSGEAFREVLAPGQRFRPGWLERGSRFVGYAVSAHEHLRYRFHEQVTCGGVESSDHVTIHVTLGYRVQDPAVVATKLSWDPLGSIEREIRDLLHRESRHLDPSSLEAGQVDLEAVVLEPGPWREASHRERLRELATTLGLELLEVRLSHRLSVEAIETGRRIVHQQRSRLENSAVHQTALQQAHHQAEIDLITSRAERGVQDIQRVGNVLDEAAGHLSEAIHNIARESQSPTDLRRSIVELMELRSELTGTPGEPGGGTPALPPTSRSGAPRALPTSSWLDDQLREGIEEMVRVLSTLDCRPPELRRMAACSLHVLAERSLGEEADAARLAQDREALKELHDAWVRAGSTADMTSDQVRFFRQLLTESLPAGEGEEKTG